MNEYEIYDDESGKTLIVEAPTLEQAIERSESIDYALYSDGDRISGAELFRALLMLRKTHSKIELACKMLESSRGKDDSPCLVLENLKDSRRLLREGYEQVKEVYLSDKSEELRESHKEWPL
tara:strand:- start:124 stop:489 length:366 start_codon:yes stop_codon:yes gene_type:complete